MRTWIARLGNALLGGLLALALVLMVFMVFPEAQSFVIGYFSRIYLGSTSGSQIRWGTGDPTLPCVPGSLYAQKTSATVGDIWRCAPIAPGETPAWSRIAAQIRIGDDFYATQFGVTCDGATDDAVALQNTIDAALEFADRAGRVILPAGTCNFGTPLMFGPVTDPFQAGTDDPLSETGVGLSFTAPRAATVVFTASPSSNISFVAGVITAADVGNYVFYGAADATYSTVFGETRVLNPTYGCEITAFLTSTTATCVATPYQVTAGVPLTTTTGSQSVFITDEHSFEIDNAVFNSSGTAALAAGHVGKTMQFVVPMLPAYLSFANANRPGSHVLDERTTAAPCTGDPATDNWQCPTDENIKSKYFTATITSVISPTEGTMQINGLQGGSNWQAFFPDYPVHAGESSICGGTDANCAALASHQWGHLVPGETMLIGRNPHLDHYASPTWASISNQYQNKHTYLGTIFPYTLPVDTEQQYVSFKGSSQARTVLNFTGCPATTQWADYCAAILFSKNKYFTWEDMTLVNGSGSDIDDLTQWGAYFGGLPGVGAQALVFQVNRVEINGFGVCWQFGDDNGAAASDFDMTTVAATRCGIGMRTTGQNTLDIAIHDLLGGFNKVAFLNYSGNVHISKAGLSYNLIDFASAGFGPFTIEDVRTEGPGIPFYGGEPGLTVKSVQLAEPQASRQLEGDVVATPNDIHTVAGVDISNVSVGVPANSFYPITFGSGDITAEDIRKIVYIPGVGASGVACVGQIWTVDSLTTGTVFVSKSACVQSAGVGITLTIYDSATCDLTFPADQITPGDIGGALALPDSSVVGAWNRAVRAVILTVDSTTTGTCGFFLGNQGNGPVTPLGGTDTDPYLFVNMGALLDMGARSFNFQSNMLGTGMVVMPMTSAAGFTGTMLNNQVWTVGEWPLSPQYTGKRYAFDLDLTNPDLSILPTPTSSLSGNVGIVLPWTLVDTTNGGFTGSANVVSAGNLSYLYGGPDPWQLREGNWQLPINTNEAVQTITRAGISFDSLHNPFAQFLNPLLGPRAPMQQLARVRELSESGVAGGKNLRSLCTFATAATCTWTFERAEAVEVRRGVAMPTTFDPVTRTYGMNVTSGNFSQADVGKPFVLEDCCTGTNGGDNFYGYVVEIVSATVITVRQLPGGNSFPNGITAGNATIGQDEPDAKWLPAIWGCGGLDTANNEVVTLTSFTAGGFVLTSSNATSTARCLVGIIR